MSTNTANVMFHSPLAPLLEQFIQEKRACGYRYDEPARLLALFDQHLCSEAPAPATLPRSLTSGWIDKRPHESAATHQHRVSIVRQFALFMGRLGHAADVPSGSLATKNAANFIPRILTRAEVQRVLCAVDGLTPTAHSPLRHLIMPEVFRLLYGCGFRLNEVLHLRVADVDFNRGVLTVREGKFGKDRLVPPTVALVQRLQNYDAGFGRRRADAFFFPSREDAAWPGGVVYRLFRHLLLQCGIPHGGRGQGPRLHDLRHTFAVHTLVRWYREGADLDAKLPVLATYLGHQSLLGTQRYLHLTAELFPEITARANVTFGDVIPRRVTP